MIRALNHYAHSWFQKLPFLMFFKKYFSTFVAEYGTSYVEEVSMGAKLVVETRFNKRAEGVDETKQRMGCIAVSSFV